MARRHIAALFDDRHRAEQAIDALSETGVRREDISLTMRDREELKQLRGATNTKAAEGAGTGAATGTVVGGVAGLLVGAGLLTIPGIGPILAIGPLSAAIGTGAAIAGATAVGAGAGAATGGLLGALVGWGIPEDEAHVYTEGVRHGSILMVVGAEENQSDSVRAVLREYGAVDVENRRGEYREDGWKGFDPEAPNYPLVPPPGNR